MKMDIIVCRKKSKTGRARRGGDKEEKKETKMGYGGG